MEEWRKQELLEKAAYIFRSKTKYAEKLRRLVAFYHDNLETAPPLPAEKPKDSLAFLKAQTKEAEARLAKLEKAARNLYENRTGKKWRPSLTVCQGGDQPRRGKAKRPALLVLDGGQG